jgi:hypothetical protein
VSKATGRRRLRELPGHRPRQRTGLRNKHRRRRSSSYHRAGKNRAADYYGQWHNGTCTTPERLRR